MQAWKGGGHPLWYSIYVFDLEKPPTNEILHMKVISTSRMGLVYPEVRHVLTFTTSFKAHNANMVIVSLGMSRLCQHRPY